LLGAADTVWRSAGASTPPSQSADANRITTVTRQALGETAFTAEFQNGRRLRPDQGASLLRDGARAPRHICRICTQTTERSSRATDKYSAFRRQRWRLQIAVAVTLREFNASGGGALPDRPWWPGPW